MSLAGGQLILHFQGTFIYVHVKDGVCFFIEQIVKISPNTSTGHISKTSNNVFII